MSTPAVAVPGLVFRAIRSGNVFEETVERLLQAVHLGAVLPGERLPAERELAASLGVSRITLRDALESLRENGFLESRRGRYGGTFVIGVPASAGGSTPRPSTTEVEDVLVLRDVLEVGAAVAAARNGAGIRPELEQALADCRAADVASYRVMDSRLHLAVAAAAGSPSLSAAVADVRMRTNALLDAIPLLERNIRHSDTQHDRVVRAVVAGRPDEARDAMREHLAGTAALLRGFLT